MAGTPAWERFPSAGMVHDALLWERVNAPSTTPSETSRRQEAAEEEVEEEEAAEETEAKDVADTLKARDSQNQMTGSAQVATSRYGHARPLAHGVKGSEEETHRQERARESARSSRTTRRNSRSVR